MNKNFNIGISVHNFEHIHTFTQLKYLIINDIKIDFIIFHQKIYKRLILKYLNFFLKKNHKETQYFYNKISNVKVYNISDLNSDYANNILQKHKPAILISNTGIIKKKTIDNNPDICFLNAHESKLPKYRGVSNIHWALWNKDDIYITIHRINKGIDEGDILYQLPVIEYSNFSLKKELLNQMYELSAQAICDAIKKYLNNEIDFQPQELTEEPLMQYYSMHPLLKNILELRLSKIKG